jgi:tRNA (guanine-N7-)-methyltransferase
MLKSYVIRSGRYTTAQKKAYDLYSSDFLIPFSQENIDFSKIYGNANGVTVEIGFGSGFATALIAEKNPGKNYLGIEVHRPGIGRLLWEIEKKSLSNIRIVEYDAAQVMEKMIKKDSLEAIHVFFPDPWPKKRHQKRRLMQRPFTEVLAACLKNEGYLYMVTDWEDYAIHALGELNACCNLKNAHEGFAPAQDWRPVTKFELKGLMKKHSIQELFFIKNRLK